MNREFCDRRNISIFIFMWLSKYIQNLLGYIPEKKNWSKHFFNLYNFIDFDISGDQIN